jgi:uncharacterized protein (TIGR02597 family)
MVTSFVRSQGQTVSTIPAGNVTVSIPATNASQTTITYIGLPLLNEPVYAGSVVSVAANTITVSGTPWASGQLTTATSPYFVKVISGQQAGRFMLVTLNTNNTLTVDTSDHSTQITALNGTGFAVQANDTIQVVPGNTLASFLGDGSTNNPVQLVGGTSAFTADGVSIYDPTAGRSFSYYFNTSRNAWNLSTSTVSQNSQFIYPEMVLGITRRPNRPALSLGITGSAPEVSLLAKTVGGATSEIYGSTRFPADITLSALNISGWTESNSVFTADTLALWNQASGQWISYYQLKNGQWRQSGNATTDQSNLLIPAGLGIQILKRTAVSGQASFLSVTMPYNLVK